jgi:hypothetical protein
MGFVITPMEAENLLKIRPEYSRVIGPFINGDDVMRTANQQATRCVIDFADSPLEIVQAQYPEALQILRERVLPGRQHDPEQMRRWWQFWNTRMGMRAAIAPLPRFAICVLHAKRLLLIWAEPHWRPSHACGVFAFDDDYHFGVCSSRVHDVWARANSSTLEDRLRYTPTTAFATFPFPTPVDKQRERIASVSRRIVELRRLACDSIDAGLTKVYNLMDDGGFVELKAAHRELDLAVMDAYGWDAVLLDKPAELLDALFDLNEKCAKDSNYKPFPKTSSSPSLLDLSEDD